MILSLHAIKYTGQFLGLKEILILAISIFNLQGPLTGNLNKLSISYIDIR